MRAHQVDKRADRVTAVDARCDPDDALPALPGVQFDGDAPVEQVPEGRERAAGGADAGV